MPLIKLKNFLEKVKKEDHLLSTTKLCLKTKKGVNSFIAALNDPANLGVQSITELDLSGSDNLSIDKIVKLVEALNKCPHIKTLHLNGCKITDGMASILRNAKYIDSLSLQNNLLQYPLLNGNLISINLDNNQKLDAKYVIHNFTMHSPKKLTTLSLNNCGVKDAAFLPLVNHYRKVFLALTHLSLRKNKLTPKGIEGVAALSTLTTLDLSDNNLNGKRARAINKNQGMEFLQKLAALKTLVVESCGLDAEGFKHIAQIPLHHVNLRNNPEIKNTVGLGGISLERVFNGEQVAEVKSIDVKPVDVKSGKAKPGNAKVEEVQLAEVKPAEVVLKPIEPNETLQVLDLSSCNLRDREIPALKRAFPQLTQLLMPHSSLRTKGVISLLEIQSLQTLDIAFSTLYTKNNHGSNATKRKANVASGKMAMEPLLDAIRKAPELTEINLENTGLTAKMLLSLIPSAEEGARKLVKINGISCKKLKKTLEQEIAAKKEAKELEKQVVLSKPVEVAEVEVIEIAPPKRLSRKELEEENARLKAELAVARQEISRLKVEKTPIISSTNSVKQMVAKIDEVTTGPNSVGRNPSSIFGTQASKSKVSTASPSQQLSSSQ